MADTKKDAVKETVEKAAEAVKTEAKAAKETVKKTAAKTGTAAKKAAAKTGVAAKKAATKTTAAAKKATTAAKKTVKKASEKKAAAKKAAGDNVVLQYNGKDFEMKAVLEACKADYKAQTKKTAKNVSVYVKPEDNAAYYVVGDFNGKVDL